MDPPSHKRTKSQLGKSLLHRVSSHSSIPPADQESETPARTSNVGSDGGSFTSASQSGPVPPSPRPSQYGSQRSSKHRPHLSASMSSANITRSEGGTRDGPMSPEKSAHQDRGPSSPTATSLEQSVKLFRLFEALRNGDTTAISRAMREQSADGGEGKVEGTTILHMAIQCAEQAVIEFTLSSISAPPNSAQGINARDRDGNSALHVAARLNRAAVVRLLLQQKGINDGITNYQGQTPLDLAHSPDVSQQLSLARSLYLDSSIQTIHEYVGTRRYDELETLLADQRLRATLDIDSEELPTNLIIRENGGTLLHEAAKNQDHKLIQLLLLHGADPFRRDHKGKLPQDITKDERTRAILKKSPAATAAQRGVQERTILGASAPQAGGAQSNDHALGNKEGREMKGYLKKWTNYTAGWKLRWFVLEDGVLSYYKHQDDAGTACRGAINMRIAKLTMDPQDKLKFEILGKSSVRYHLKANHQVECKRWFWALNNAIQWSRDEAKEEDKRQKEETEMLRQAKELQLSQQRTVDDAHSFVSAGSRPFVPSTAIGVPTTSQQSASTFAQGEDDQAGGPDVAGRDITQVVQQTGAAVIAGDVDDDEEYGDDASSHELQPIDRDAFGITAQSLKLQLDVLTQVSSALQVELDGGSQLPLSHPMVKNALSTYDSAIGNVRGLVGDLLRISKDREAYWQYRLDREANIRRMWEDSMAKFAQEHEELQEKLGENEDKRKRTKRALKDALENLEISQSAPGTPVREVAPALKAAAGESSPFATAREPSISGPPRRKSTFVDLSGISDDESEDDEEFFDAVNEGDIEVVEDLPKASPPLSMVSTAFDPLQDARSEKAADIIPSFKGYEEPVRKRLKMDADNRPKISLWGILKSMIGKDMTKMTLPVSFNEPTSLLQRVAEDMEYTDLLDTAADRTDSMERMVYVAAFAASEYASTIGRVAKPFNPLLGETYEYARPDKGYRFFIEQVSHHPPIGAAWAESAKWDYYGESAVKSKFYGKSFDINPLGTWFLKLRPASGGEELYTWKKVTSSVIGIITGNPTVDNYGIMEVKNWTTGETCTLDFKARGWKPSSAFQVAGRVSDASGQTRWSIGGKWNDKIYARLTPGWEDSALLPTNPSHANLSKGNKTNTEISSTQAFLVWEANPRPTGIPFNLTPFVLTLNALPDSLRPHLAPTDTRLRPDQRAMEDGLYDFAATEKNRVEEGQRARRRVREQMGGEFVPRWFVKDRCEVTGEEYWRFNAEYWAVRRRVGEGGMRWEEQGLEEIF